MKKILTIGIIVAVIIGAFIYLIQRNTSLRDELETATNNVKAYVAQNSSLKEDNRVFKLTIEQLNYYKDSIINKMIDVQKQLEIKDKQLVSMQYLVNQSQRVDTIIFKDTLFLNPELKVDTTIGDKWYRCIVGLEYPSKITINPTFKSELYIFTSDRKETIKPPKKFFLSRLFQRKHTVRIVQILEKSPYVENKEQKFIEIVR